MKRFMTLAVTAVALAACSDVQEPLAPETLAPLHVAIGADALPGSYIVVLEADANPRSVAAILGVDPNRVYESTIAGFAAELNDGKLNALRRNPAVAYIEMDRVVTLAPPCGTPNGGPCPPDDDDDDDDQGSQVTPWGVERVGGPIAGASGTAWVIDTGIDLDHPDLNVDVSRSVNYVSRGKNSADDGNGHGTHVAGTIAALDNGRDVVGVAPGAPVVAVRVLDNRGSGSYADIIAGVDYVGGAGSSGDVANMSLGGPGSTALDDAVQAAAGQIRFVLAAGNNGADADDYSPARVNGSGIYTISATGDNDCLTSWSNWGNPPVDYAEPGAGILSTRSGGGTTTMSGTSMAAPHAAGLLLVGGIRSGGTACGDPDGNADTIGVH